MAGWWFGPEAFSLGQALLHTRARRQETVGGIRREREMPWQFNPTSDATRLNKYIDEMTDHPAKKGPVYLSRLGESTIKKGTCVCASQIVQMRAVLLAVVARARGFSSAGRFEPGRLPACGAVGDRKKSQRTKREK